MWRRGKLSNRILMSVVAILVATTGIGFGLNAASRRSELQHEYEQRALAIARTFAAIPTIRSGLENPTAVNSAAIQTLAKQVMAATAASYIVVIDRNGIRYSHPNPALIGQKVGEPVIALDGRDHVDVDHGNLGVSANAKVPLRAPDGQIIGEVSAGIPEGRVSDQLIGEVPQLILYFLLSLAIGVCASLLLTRQLKRSTFGLELEEIAALVHEREAMLHNIREGVITTNPSGRVTLINDEARRLLGLGLSYEIVGQPIEQLTAGGRLRSLLTGAASGQDQIVLTDDHILVVNRVVAAHAGQPLGAVVTLRDRTELEALLRELDGVESLITALRAQQHEFSNRMHTVAGLIELGDHSAAARYALDVSRDTSVSAEALRAKIESPEIAAMLLAKMTVAGERHVTLTVAKDSHFPAEGVDTNAVLTILGNLIDNAIDAAAAGSQPADVTVRLVGGDPATIEVSDSGNGIPEAIAPDIFNDGFSTKAARSDRPRGIGLALVQRLVRRAGGELAVSTEERTRFTVVLPLSSAAPVTVSG